MKKVCFFGIYDPDYARNRVLKNAFEENGVEVVECRVDPKINRGIRKYFALYKRARSLKEDFDIVVVNFPGQSVVWLARLLFKKLIVFDAFLSLYDSNVFDRKLYSRFHPRAMYDWFLDWSSVRLSHKVLLDTYEHIKYFKDLFCKEDIYIRVPISADESLFRPMDVQIPDRPFIAHFHGMFIPLQGVRYILEAAEELKGEDIVFNLIGSGQEFVEMKKLATDLGLANASFVGKVPFSEVPRYIAKSHVCLGIFGDTDKTKRVIPNKVYEYAAMGKAIITADTIAIREVFTNGEDVVLCRLANGQDLAKTIKNLMGDPNALVDLGKHARETFVQRLNAKALGKELISNLNV